MTDDRPTGTAGLLRAATRLLGAVLLVGLTIKVAACLLVTYWPLLLALGVIAGVIVVWWRRRSDAGW